MIKLHFYHDNYKVPAASIDNTDDLHCHMGAHGGQELNSVID